MELKEIYSKKFLQDLGQEIVQYYESFDIDQFVKDCLQLDWDDLKLMERSDRITQSLHNQFPKEFKGGQFIKTNWTFIHWFSTNLFTKLCC